MLQIIFGIFVVLHGLVHLLYFGHSARYFEMKPGMPWPDGSWAFSRILGDDTTRNLASILLIASALIFVAGGAGIFFKQEWHRTVIVIATVLSSITYLLLWDGAWQNLDGKGFVGILINVGILIVALVLHWPKF
ncbi:MAG: hypothetical protein JXA42_10855 [Anaerolineales bacterium]|nr:hypothetical protein [Anaerolineales bacterium]